VIFREAERIEKAKAKAKLEDEERQRLVQQGQSGNSEGMSGRAPRA
jgi:hypothetical protein